MGVRPSTLVDRDPELMVIGGALASAREGRGMAVALLGEPGIGKSRLAAEAATRASACGMCVLRGRGSRLGPTVAFRPLTEALLSAVRAGEPGLGTNLGPYRRSLGRLIPEWSENAVGSDGASPVVLAEGVLRLISALGRVRGCLVVLDDLQDVDADTLQVMEYLFDNIADQPVVLIAVVGDRPCSALDVVRAAAQRGSCRALPLDRLSRDGLRILTAGRLGSELHDVPEPAVQQLWSSSAGHPLVAEEILDAMLRSSALRLSAASWTWHGGFSPRVPVSLSRAVSSRAEELPATVQHALRTAAVFGDRFSLTVVSTVSRVDPTAMQELLHVAATADLVRPDDADTEWYQFRHPLTAQALLSQVSPSERADLAGRAADAIATAFPDLPGNWCAITAQLRADAGDRQAAARLFLTSGRRARAAGAANSAVQLLERSLCLLGDDAAGAEQSTILEELIHALVDAGHVERALTHLHALDTTDDIAADRRVRLHVRLAWAASTAGRDDDGRAQVRAARVALGFSSSAGCEAAVDVIDANLTSKRPGRGDRATAEAQARRAAVAAEHARLPDEACRAWVLIGCLVRHRDANEATVCFERARTMATRYQLPIWEIRALICLGADDTMRDGSTSLLERARDKARTVGAVTADYEAELSLALQYVLFGDYVGAAEVHERVWPSVARLRLSTMGQYALLTRAVLAAHRCHRAAMDRALAEMRRSGADQSPFPPLAYGLARAFCALLEEDRARAMEELERANRWEDEHAAHYQLTGRHGLHLLLLVLAGEADQPEFDSVVAESPAQARWNRQFLHLAQAVIHGRAGRRVEAQASAERAFAAAQRYEMARHLGVRLVADAALVDGWGVPIDRLRDAEEYFFTANIPATASACRALLRVAGEPMRQRRRGADRIPRSLRSRGVTVREFEVLQLVVNRHGNRSIASRLHISPRTVEKHVASLLAKTETADRVALGEYAAQALGA